MTRSGKNKKTLQNQGGENLQGVPGTSKDLGNQDDVQRNKTPEKVRNNDKSNDSRQTNDDRNSVKSGEVLDIRSDCSREDDSGSEFQSSQSEDDRGRNEDRKRRRRRRERMLNRDRYRSHATFAEFNRLCDGEETPEELQGFVEALCSFKEQAEMDDESTKEADRSSFTWTCTNMVDNFWQGE